MKEIRIPIPSLPDLVSIFRVQKEKIKFRLFGFKCSCCGQKMFYKHPQYSGYLDGKRLILSSFGKPIVCLDCLVKQALERKVWSSKKKNTCYWCGSHEQTTRWLQGEYSATTHYETGITFGAEWWNGFNICKTCFAKIPKAGLKDHSGHVVYDSKLKKSFYKNEVGVLDTR